MRRMVLLLISTVFIYTPSLATEIQESQLANGLKIIVAEDHRAPVVLTSVWYKVGSSYENNGKTGLSHMLEHMMFKGTKQFGPRVFNQLISDNGGDDNANTADDFTVYFETVGSQQLKTVFELEADRMHNLLLNEDDFKKEKQVVMEERRMRVDDDPQSTTWERFRAAAFVNNPYHHPVIGWMTDIAHYTLHDVQAWYDTWYTPNNAVIVVVGDIKTNEVFALAKKYFGSIKPKNLPTLKPRHEVAALGEKQIQINVSARLPWLVMGYPVPTLANDTNKKEIFALLLCAKILGGAESARLQTDLVRKQKIATTVGTSYDRYDLHQSVFVLEGVASQKYSNAQLKDAMLAEIKKLQTTPMTKTELDHAKAQLITHHVYQNDSLIKRAFELGVPEMVGLSWRESNHFASDIQAITPQDIQMVAKKYFVRNHLTIAELQCDNMTKM